MPPDAPKILIAEDNPQQQFKTRELFELCGCRVVEASGGPEAFELALAETPDMILLDLRIPVLDGFEVARRLRKIAEFRGVPLIAYTARFSPGLKDEALALGFDEYVAKPVSQDDARELLRRHLNF